MRKPREIRPRRVVSRPKNCWYCVNKTKPEWEGYEKLRDFLSVRGRILSRNYTGICVKHQRQLTEAIKRARHLGLLPFTTMV